MVEQVHHVNSRLKENALPSLLIQELRKAAPILYKWVIRRKEDKVVLRSWSDYDKSIAELWWINNPKHHEYCELVSVEWADTGDRLMQEAANRLEVLEETLKHLKHMIWLVEIELSHDGGHILENAKSVVTKAEA